MPLYEVTHGCWSPVAGSHFEAAWEDTIKYSLVLEQASLYQRAFSCQPWFAEKGLTVTLLQAAKPPFILVVLQSKDERPRGCRDFIGLSRPVRDKKTSKVKISLRITHQAPLIDEAWINRYRKQLVRSISPQFLEEIICYLRRLDLLTAEEAGRAQEASSLPEQVRAVVDLLAGKGSYASQSLQTFIETTNSQLYLHITVYEPMVQKHLESLQSYYGNGLETGPLQRLTNLLLVEGLTDVQQKEHDILQIEATKGLQNVSIPPRISVTIGVAGIGKSTLVKLFVYTWAKGEINRDIIFVLPLTFRELNTYEKLSVEKLICSAFPHITEPNCISAGAARTLLILDGLDEFKTPLDFSNTVVCTDPKKEIQVDNLITNIIRGNLLQEASVWVTSRPAAASQIPGGLVDRMTEIRGFGAAEMKDFLDQMFLDNKDLSGQVLHHIRANRTLSEIYSYYFKMALSSDWPEKPRETLRIEQAVNNSKKIDMKAYGIDLSLLQSSLCSRLLLKEEMQSFTAYCFCHLTLQEFLAAIYYYTAAKRAIFDLFTESGMSWPKLGFLNHFKNAVNKLLSGWLLVKDEHNSFRSQAIGFLQGCLNTDYTISSRAVNTMHCLHEIQHMEVAKMVSDVCMEETNLSNCLTYNICKSLLSQLLFCHNLRLDNNQFKDNVMELLGSMLSVKDCHIQKLRTCQDPLSRPENTQFFLLLSSLAENQISNKGAKALARSLLVNRSLTALDLRNNSIGPAGAKALADALKQNQVLLSLKPAHGETLDTTWFSCTGSKHEHSWQRPGAEIRLPWARDVGILLPISFSGSTLSLQHNAIKEEGATFLAEALLTNHRLTTLHLQKNAVGAHGASRIAEALKQNCSLKELILSSNSVGDNGSVALAEALKVNHSLQSLDLQSNSISSAGVTALTEALCSNKGLINLNLRENSISKEGGPAIAHALRTNSTLRKLDLAANLLHDEGGKAIALAMKENRALKSLHLQWNFIQANAAAALAQALQSNSSLASLDLQVASIGMAGAQALAEALTVNKSLQILDLRGNSIGVAGAKAMANALKVNRSLRWLNLQENSLGMDGAICIATALKGNHGLTYIKILLHLMSKPELLFAPSLQGNRIGQSGAKMISDAIRTNSPSCVVDV
ncbi:protein NLRC3 [Amazona aestiva]|uniref:Protein NLRC3 n=1 Tax=Amazona aestiva TaxID=12930 RepID=A0A0Q3REM8_AMAAE|nr:protein NLRC3 [Amazona aestiva]